MHPIRLRGARTHNLRGVNLDLFPGELVALTGPSGAGKSSLALDTLYAEGQRRFVESFSPYARQFLERLERPPIDSLDPIAATVAVDRRAPIKSSRSTLATLADLEAYLAALFAREAVPRCPDCDVDAVSITAAVAAARLVEELGGQRAVLSYPVRTHGAGEYLALRESLVRDGYRRLVVDNRVRDIDDVRPSETEAAGGPVEVVLDRIALGKHELRRVQQAIEIGHERGGRVEVRIYDQDSETPSERRTVGRGLVCPSCAHTFEPPRPALFSYNNPVGACESCRGFGRVISVDWDKVLPDHERTLEEGAIKAWAGTSAEWERGELVRFCKQHRIPMGQPWRALTDGQRALVIEGEGAWSEGKFPGVRAWFKWLEGRTYKMHVRVFLARYREFTPCVTCGGARLNPTALGYRVAGHNLADWHELTVAQARKRLDAMAPIDAQAKRVQKELGARLGYLDAVGLGYLTLSRPARTLSGGEAQRAGLTTALGATLTGALFVLDEPTVGLHASDAAALGRVMRELARAGNSVLVIEHEASIVRACDRVIELGPGAGREGGTILFDGSPADLAKRTDLPTGAAWASAGATKKKGGLAVPARPRRVARGHIEIEGVEIHNLRAVDVRVPRGVLCAITGPSGSGKSTLARDVLYNAVARALGDTSVPRPGAHRRLDGIEGLKAAVLVDQAPLGRTARGNPATYTKAWDRIRARFAAEPEAAAAELTASHFSFNAVGRGGATTGRCEACSGEGYETVEMQFLADVALLCPVCRGKRFKPEVLAIRHEGLSVADALALTVDEAMERLSPTGRPDYVLERALLPVQRVGLGYLPLGQPLSMLSGGEAQRLKLARALSEPAMGRLFVVDEPSAGLHARDAAFVIAALDALVDEGASVVVVDHDLDVISAADHVIDLGPGGGPDGGRIVAVGTPEQIEASGSRTGIALQQRLKMKRGDSPIAVDKSLGSSHVRSPLPDAIRVVGAREHNLRDVSCEIPHGRLCVVTGPSGSGKSSLAFDVVFAEGQRRYMETLTPYARQFLPTLPRPEVDRVEGVPPSIALEQRTARGGGNSTVATVTEVAHYLRLLYAKVGTAHCPKCDAAVAPSSPDALYARLTASPTTKRGVRGEHTVYAPAVRARKGTYLDLFTAATRAGITEARVDGELVAIEPPPKLAKSREHTIDLVIHVGALASLSRDCLDRALSWGDGAVRVAPGIPSASAVAGEALHSTKRACPSCGESVPELDPRWFSFNTKQGQCEVCEGAGALGSPDESLKPCRACEGTRLAPIPRRVKLQGETYPDFVGRDVGSALARVRGWKFTGSDAEIARAAHAELVRRLAFCHEVGLGYLALSRSAATLSGGEMQRLRLSAQLGSGLTGALYVLDEPTIGLHPRDTQRLLDNLRGLVDTGSTVLVVEHDAETIRAADHLIDLGPGGGRNGGRIVAQGPAAEVLANPDSPTGRALAESVAAPRKGRGPALEAIELRGASEHNLKNVDLRIPVGRVCVVAGVSGSGKSTLVRRVLYPALRRALGLVAEKAGAHKSIHVPAGSVKRALAVDQSPIGRTPRSVPATFLGVWDEIRRLYAALPEARQRGFALGRFSFNTGAGRCPACEGQGAIVAEMSFLPDVISPCQACGGSRFEPATLDLRYAGLSVGDVLHLSATEAARVFAAHPKIARPLAMLDELGVGYLQLGQGSHTLSGGEAQRLKLAAEVTAGVAHEATVYLLDEPTTGLHVADVRRLVGVMDRLADRGDTLVVIEHHPEVIAAADHVIELGPEAGPDGGSIVFEGTPAALAKAKTATGRYLARSHGKAARNAL